MAESENEPLVTIDNLEDIFAQTVGSIRGSAGMILWCWATYSSMSLDILNQSVSTYLSVIWFLCVAAVRFAMYINSRLVDGLSAFNLDPRRDVIVITGGSSGLGLLLLAMFSADGFTTINLDLRAASIGIAKSLFYKCDVSSASSVAATVSDMSIELGEHRQPAVLINCAGIVANSMGPIEKIRAEDLRRVIETNLTGSIYTTRELLRLNPQLKMVVGISSSTALVGPAYAGIYAASKAGLRVFLESLRQECRYKQTRVLSVVLGQLDTDMFKDVSTPSPFWAPISKASDVAHSIYESVLKGRQGELTIPLYARLLPYILILPRSVVDLFRLLIGVDLAAKHANHDPSINDKREPRSAN